jgi:hypothetical protein
VASIALHPLLARPVSREQPGIVASVLVWIRKQKQ